MTFYIVRHKETGHILPQFERGRGYTYWTPTDPQYEDNGIPRLFNGKLGAGNFIRAWTKGHAVRVYSRSSDMFGEDDIEDLTYEAVPGRAADQLEILPAELKIGKPL